MYCMTYKYTIKKHFTLKCTLCFWTQGQATIDDYLNLNTCHTSIILSMTFIFAYPRFSYPFIKNPFSESLLNTTTLRLCGHLSCFVHTLGCVNCPPLLDCSTLMLTKLSKHLAVFPVSGLDEWCPMHENFNGNNMSNSAAFLIGKIKLMNKSKRPWNNPIVP